MPVGWVLKLRGLRAFSCAMMVVLVQAGNSDGLEAPFDSKVQVPWIFVLG